MRRNKQKSTRSLARAKINGDESTQTTSGALETLQGAWNDQSYHMSSDERLLFLEVTERVVKMHDQLKMVFEMEEQMRKN